MASRVISSKPGGARLYIQRKNIQLSHKFGMIDDLEAAASYEQLARHYEKLVRSRPLVLAEGRRAEVKTLYYTGPFKSEMTHREARQILGVTDAYVPVDLPFKPHLWCWRLFPSFFMMNSISRFSLFIPTLHLPSPDSQLPTSILNSNQSHLSCSISLCARKTERQKTRRISSSNGVL